MSSKKGAKVEVKSEVTTLMETQEQDACGEDSDGESRGNDHNDEQIRSAATVIKKEQSEVKSEVKSEGTKEASEETQLAR
jgi:hypothetical protein